MMPWTRNAQEYLNGTHGLRKQTLWECDIYGKSQPLVPEPIVLEPTVAIVKQLWILFPALSRLILLLITFLYSLSCREIVAIEQTSIISFQENTNFVIPRIQKVVFKNFSMYEYK